MLHTVTDSDCDCIVTGHIVTDCSANADLMHSTSLLIVISLLLATLLLIQIVVVLLLAMLLVIVMPLLLATLLFAVPTQTYRAGGARVESEDGAKV